MRGKERTFIYKLIAIEEERMGELVDQCTPLQRLAGGLSMCLSAIVMILGFWWGSHGNSKHEGWLGGFNKCTLHAVLMLLGMCFCYTQAIVSFRVLHSLGHGLTKFLHFLWHSCTVGLMIAALTFIIKWHNEMKLGHLTSMHSWLGLMLVFIYFQNWVLGIVSFGGVISLSEEFKRKYLPSHRFLGIVGVLLAAVVMETGIAQKNWLDGPNGCLYTFTDNQYKQDPASGYDEIADGCRAALGIGLILILNTIAAIFALWQFPVDNSTNDKHNQVRANNFEIIPAMTA